MSFDYKEVYCECGQYFTPPKEYNRIWNEFTRDPYVEGIVKDNGKYKVLYCPKCNREAGRIG